MRHREPADVFDYRYRSLIVLAALLLPAAAFAQNIYSAALSWTHAGDNLGEFRIYAGRSPSTLGQIQIAPSSVRMTSVDGLGPGAWYFAVGAVTPSPNVVESWSSNVVCVVKGGTGTCPAFVDVLPPNPVRNLVVSQSTAAVQLTSADIGGVGAPGSTTQTASGYTISASGFDIWSTNDEFRFAYRQLAGNGEITARVDSLVLVDQWSKAGVMFRESLAANSRMAMTLVSGSRGVDFESRATTGGDAGPAGQYDVVTRAPYWLRLRRAGDVFTAYVSADGVTWRQQGAPVTIAMGANPYVGLAVTAHNDGLIATAAFSNITILPL